MDDGAKVFVKIITEKSEGNLNHLAHLLPDIRPGKLEIDDVHEL